MNNKVVIYLISILTDLTILTIFSTLAIVFNKFWIVFISIFFIVLENSQEEEGKNDG